MRPISLIILFCLFIIFSANATPYYTNSDHVNIRAGMSINSHVLGTLSKGTTIEVLAISGSWAKIKYQNNDCYISMKFLTEMSSPSYSNQGYFNPWPAIIILLVIVVSIVTFLKKVFRGIGAFFGFGKKSYENKGFTPSPKPTDESGEERGKSKKAEDQDLAKKAADKQAKDEAEQLRKEQEDLERIANLLKNDFKK